MGTKWFKMSCTNCIHVDDCEIQLRVEEQGLDLMACIAVNGRAGKRHIVTEVDDETIDNGVAWVKEHGSCSNTDNRCGLCSSCSEVGICHLHHKTCWDIVADHMKCHGCGTFLSDGVNVRCSKCGGLTL